MDGAFVSVVLLVGVDVRDVVLADGAGVTGDGASIGILVVGASIGGLLARMVG